MTDSYMLSIIIPHNNSPELLEKLLSTIPDKKEVQIIVIDDHSDITVKTQLQKLQSLYNGRNILFLENDTSEHNPGATRNIGLKYAEGKWLLFADADDYFLDGFYEIVKKYFETDYDIVFFSPTSIQLDTGEPDIRHLGTENLVKDFLKRPCLATEVRLRFLWAVPWSKLIRNSLVKGNNITFESIQIREDDMFSVKAGFYAKKITAIDETIYCVTRSAGSITTKRDLDIFDIRAQESIRRNQFLKTHLTKKEFRASESYRITIQNLLLILQRRYGIDVFFKYLRLFRQNKLPIFDIRIFNPKNFMRWLRNRHAENEIKMRYRQ